MRAVRLAGAGVVVLAAVSVVPATPVGAAVPGVTERVSVAAGGGQAGATSWESAVSGNGRYVAFFTAARLAPADTNSLDDIYVRDLVTHRTVLVTAGSDGGSSSPSLSGSGRYVAFTTSATNLTGEDRDRFDDAVVCDRDPDGNGAFDESATPRCLWAGRAPTILAGARFSDAFAPRLAAGAGTISWEQRDTNADGSGTDHVVVRRLVKHAGGALTRGGLVQLPFGSGQTDDEPAVSADGRHVAFPTWGRTGPTAFSMAVAMVDLVDGQDRAQPIPVSYGEDGRLIIDARTQISDVSVSGNGRLVAFGAAEFGSAVVRRVYVVDRDPDGNGRLGPAGGEPVRSRIESRDVQGRPADGALPALSADGRFLAFVTGSLLMHDGTPTAANYRCLGDGTQTPCPVVIRDLVTDRARELARLPRLPAQLATPSATRQCPGGCEDDGDHWSLGLSTDGHVLAFIGNADDTVPADTNKLPDAFARLARLAVAVQPGQLDFGARPPGSTSPARTVTVTNTGQHVLSIGSVRLPSGPGQFPQDFTLSADTCAGTSLQPGQACRIQVTHHPAGLGPRPAVLRIDDTAPASPHLVLLHGAGTTATGQANPTMQADPAVTPPGRVIAVTGHGFPPDAPVTFTGHGIPQPSTIAADHTGSFSIHWVVLSGWTGPTTLQASYPGGAVEAPYLVQPGTLSPPGWTTRR